MSDQHPMTTPKADVHFFEIPIVGDVTIAPDRIELRGPRETVVLVGLKAPTKSK